MTRDELLTRIVDIVDSADSAQDLLDADDDTDTDSTAVDIDYDAYQEIHKLLRLAGLLKGK